MTVVQLAGARCIQLVRATAKSVAECGLFRLSFGEACVRLVWAAHDWCVCVEPRDGAQAERKKVVVLDSS